jgi:hypothetical protein
LVPSIGLEVFWNLDSLMSRRKILNAVLVQEEADGGDGSEIRSGKLLQGMIPDRGRGRCTNRRRQT